MSLRYTSPADKISANLSKMQDITKFSLDQARDDRGRFTAGETFTPSEHAAAIATTHGDAVRAHADATHALGVADPGSGGLGLAAQHLHDGNTAASQAKAYDRAGEHLLAAQAHTEASNAYSNASFTYNRLANTAHNDEGAAALMTAQSKADDLSYQHEQSARESFKKAGVDPDLVKNEETPLEAAGVPANQISYLESQIAAGGHSAEVAKEIIASIVTGSTIDKRKFEPMIVDNGPGYSLPDNLRTRKHSFYKEKS